MLAAENSHWLPEKKIVKIFVSNLTPEEFCEEIYSHVFETLVDVMAETRHELANYREFIEIYERIKRPEPRKTREIGVQMAKFPGNKGDIARPRQGRLSGKTQMYLIPRRR